jgi:pilus assembly protein CpaF
MSLTTTIPATSVADTRRKDFQALKGRVHQELLNRLNLERLTRVKREDAEPEIRQVIGVIIESLTQTTPLSLLERETLVTEVLDELFGLGPLEALLKDPAISDILVNRHNQVYIERDGKLEDTEIVFRDDRHLMQIIERIVSMVGRRVDESSPMVDARLQDRWRSTDRRCRSAASGRIASALRTSWIASRSRSRCSISSRPPSRAG